MKKQFLIKTLVCCISIIALCGCSKKKDEALDTYKANMEQFFENAATINDAINGIDPAAEDADTKLLAYLDALDKSFQQMAALNVPDGFLGAKEYAEDASKYMSEAVSNYHAAYDGEYDEQSESAAYQYYERANSDLKQLLKILHGELDMSENVVYDDESEDAPADVSTSENKEAGTDSDYDYEEDAGDDFFVEDAE